MREQLDSRKRKSHSMTDQYKKETAQIHAPAALLEKTKAAVRAEEERIRKEQTARVPIPVSGLQVSYADYVAYQKKSSLRKWTYPLTAAAAVVILFSISMAMKGIGDSAGDRMADGALLSIVHQMIDELGDFHVVENGIGQDHPFLRFSFSHFCLFNVLISAAFAIFNPALLRSLLNH